MPQRNMVKYFLTFLLSDRIDTCCSQHVLPSLSGRLKVSLCYEGSAMCVKNECEETFASQSAKFTGPLVLSKGHAVRLPWTVTTVFT